MAGTVDGGIKARDAIIARDPDHYRKIGRKGGQRSGVPKVFALMSREEHVSASKKGGALGKRGPAKEKTWQSNSGASDSTLSTPKTEIPSAPSSESSSASSDCDSERKTSSFLGKLLHRTRFHD